MWVAHRPGGHDSQSHQWRGAFWRPRRACRTRSNCASPLVGCRNSSRCRWPARPAASGSTCWRRRRGLPARRGLNGRTALHSALWGAPALCWRNLSNSMWLFRGLHVERKNTAEENSHLSVFKLRKLTRLESLAHSGHSSRGLRTRRTHHTTPPSPSLSLNLPLSHSELGFTHDTAQIQAGFPA